jgi:nucleotide-binding universal stress UspA family protein
MLMPRTAAPIREGYGTGVVTCTVVSGAAAEDHARMSSTFGSIVCGVDGSEVGFEAARQAAVLTDDGAALTYVTVAGEADAHETLQRAADAGRALGASPSLLAEDGDDPAASLIDLATGHDLLAVGILGRSRAAGIVIGSAASAVLHRSPVPVLVARRPPDGVEFPSRILLASDGTPLSDAAAALTARLAARHGSAVAIVGARVGELPFRPGIAEHATQIREAGAADPEILEQQGPPHRAVADAARAFNASLVVTGSRGLEGVSALSSDSERIAHAAPCSVLVVR